MRHQYRQRDWVPTLLIEIDRATSSLAVDQIARDVKLLCVDRSVCRGILILSDALAAFSLPKDPRVKLFWVEDFSLQEANQYYDMLHFLPGLNGNLTLRAHVFNQIGTRPIDLIRLYDDTKNNVSAIEPYIQSRIKECRTMLRGFFNMGTAWGEDFKILIKEILHSPTLSVDAESLLGFGNVEDVAVILKKYHALLFHFPSQSYRFYSKCMERAAETWEASSID